jgi:hypothetical protein
MTGTVGSGTANGVFIANLISKSKYYMELMTQSIIPRCQHAKIAQKQQMRSRSGDRGSPMSETSAAASVLQ